MSLTPYLITATAFELIAVKTIPEFSSDSRIFFIPQKYYILTFSLASFQSFVNFSQNSASLLFLWSYSLSISISVNTFHIGKHDIGLKLVTSLPFSLSFMISIVLPVVIQFCLIHLLSKTLIVQLFFHGKM